MTFPSLSALAARAGALFRNRPTSAPDVILDPDADSSAFVSGPPAWLLVWALVVAYLWAAVLAFYCGSVPARAYFEDGHGATVHRDVIIGLSGFLTVHRVGSKFAKAKAAGADAGTNGNGGPPAPVAVAIAAPEDRA